MGMAYQGSEPFAFISYSHADQVKVELLLRILHSARRRFWYDAGIGFSDDWQDVINERLAGSTMFLLFMTNGIEQRPEIIREIRMAIAKRRENPAYRIYVIMLERVPVRRLFGRGDFNDILELLNTVQYLSLDRFGGVTMEFRELLAGPGIWESCLTEEERAAEGDAGESLGILSDEDEETGYVYPYAQPVLRTENGLSFYAVSIGETDPNAVYPICMDNQWVPESFFADPDFRRYGFGAEALRRERNRMQQYELITALLHNRQVLINRASVFNTEAVAAWYMSAGRDREAFCSLLQNGSFVIYLMSEHSPTERPRFDVAEEQFRRWEEICRESRVCCIRMSWDGIDGTDDANSTEIARSLSMRMMDLLLTTANDRYRLESFRRAMEIPDTEAEDFRALWCRLRDTAVARDDAAPGRFTRNSVYQEFLIKKGTNVTDCILDYERPYVCALKEIIDFCYMINLPDALHMVPVSSYENRLRDYFLSERRNAMQLRSINADELFCTVICFEPKFLKRTYAAEKPQLSLADVAAVRRLPEWLAYMEALDASRKRANRNEIDFHDVEVVWRRFRGLMEAVSALLPGCGMHPAAGTLSIIYSFGNCHLTTVYREDSSAVRIRRGQEERLTDRLRENLVIEFVCGDILAESAASNCFLEKLRLFEGILMQPAKETYDRILDALTSGPHEIDGEAFRNE